MTDLDADLDQAYDELDAMDEDMDELEEYVYGDDLEEDEEEDEEDEDAEVEYELTCPNCGAVTVVDEDTLLNEQVCCGNCGAEFEIEFTECDDEDCGAVPAAPGLRARRKSKPSACKERCAKAPGTMVLGALVLSGELPYFAGLFPQRALQPHAADLQRGVQAGFAALFDHALRQRPGGVGAHEHYMQLVGHLAPPSSFVVSTCMKITNGSARSP